MKGFVNIPVHNLLCCQINRGFKSLKVHSSDINPSNYNTMMMMPAVLFVAFLLASPNHGQYPVTPAPPTPAPPKPAPPTPTPTPQPPSFFQMWLRFRMWAWFMEEFF
ncbi:uncharacterized protein LOC121381182 isoform X2 [Gigantopelta aegis]|uniref:uncharacterized protein LOC121381182 isoform X2 n=1 Tax=Gigantopelta aegis TaxID=1735272 RepID=UPI001B88A682|nr:uncharacterized protein LOC121381182 isoform X2 [Gigantopelta aegis]